MNLTQTQITDIWNEYYPRVQGYFFKRVTNQSDVDDLTSVVMTSFLQALTKQEVESKHGLLWSIARNHLYSYFRSKKNQPLTVDVENFEASRETEDQFGSQTYHRYLEHILERAKTLLSKEELEILHYSYFDELSSQEISEKYSTTPGNIRVKLSRIISKLKLEAINLTN
jgi:RNA polymerase sigma factor (sigma-70 family)